MNSNTSTSSTYSDSLAKPTSEPSSLQTQLAANQKRVVAVLKLFSENRSDYHTTFPPRGGEVYCGEKSLRRGLVAHKYRICRDTLRDLKISITVLEDEKHAVVKAEMLEEAENQKRALRTLEVIFDEDYEEVLEEI